MDKWKDGLIDGQADRWMDRQMTIIGIRVRDLKSHCTLTSHVRGVAWLSE